MIVGHFKGTGKIQVFHAVEGFLAHSDSQGALLGYLFGHLLGGRLQFILGHNFVDQTDPIGLIRINHVPGEQKLQGLLPAEIASQRDSRAHTEETDIDRSGPKSGSFGGNGQIRRSHHSDPVGHSNILD